MTGPRTGRKGNQGTRLSHLEVGPSDAPEAAVFVHGHPGSPCDWEYLLGRVGQFRRAVAPGMPSFASAADGVRHLGGVTEELGIRRAHLLLHGSSDLPGLAWAAQNPDALASVVLVNAGAMPGNYRRAAVRRGFADGGVGALRFPETPALVLWGARDPFAPVHYAERQREIFPLARVVVFQDSGHRPFADEPEAVADEVVLFLRRNFAAREWKVRRIA